jgi:hypothetical protein
MLIVNRMESWVNVPLMWVAVLSLAAGVLMPLVFRYASDQRRIRVEKDRMKAYVLAVRLYPGQLSVVLHSYARLMRGTFRYLRLAMKPLAYIAAPLTLLITQADHYLGVRPFVPGEPFLFTLHVATVEETNEVTLIAPSGVSITAPAVHIPAEREVVWRLTAPRAGKYPLTVQLNGQRFEKSAVVSTAIRSASRVRLRGRPWARIFLSRDPALPSGSGIVSMELNYPEREIPFAWWHWNWIWLFAVLSLLIGFIAKSAMGIEI